MFQESKGSKKLDFLQCTSCPKMVNPFEQMLRIKLPLWPFLSRTSVLKRTWQNFTKLFEIQLKMMKGIADFTILQGVQEQLYFFVNHTLLTVEASITKLTFYHIRSRWLKLGLVNRTSARSLDHILKFFYLLLKILTLNRQ